MLVVAIIKIILPQEQFIRSFNNWFGVEKSWRGERTEARRLQVALPRLGEMALVLCSQHRAHLFT